MISATKAKVPYHKMDWTHDEGIDSAAPILVVAKLGTTNGSLLRVVEVQVQDVVFVLWYECELVAGTINVTHCLVGFLPFVRNKMCLYITQYGVLACYELVVTFTSNLKGRSRRRSKSVPHNRGKRSWHARR